jgi:hypothetical protein
VWSKRKLCINILTLRSPKYKIWILKFFNIWRKYNNQFIEIFRFYFTAIELISINYILASKLKYWYNWRKKGRNKKLCKSRLVKLSDSWLLSICTLNNKNTKLAKSYLRSNRIYKIIYERLDTGNDRRASIILKLWAKVKA